MFIYVRPSKSREQEEMLQYPLIGEKIFTSPLAPACVLMIILLGKERVREQWRPLKLLLKDRGLHWLIHFSEQRLQRGKMAKGKAGIFITVSAAADGGSSHFILDTGSCSFTALQQESLLQTSLGGDPRLPEEGSPGADTHVADSPTSRNL